MLTISSPTFNRFVTNGLSHSYHLDESTFILGASGIILLVLVLFLFFSFI